MEIENTTMTDSTNGPEAAPTASRYDELERMVAAMKDDFIRFYVQGNKAAGTRVRKAMQDVKNTAQEIRQEMLSTRESEVS